MRKSVPILLFVVVVMAWGTTWMAMRIAVATVPPIFGTGARFLVAAPILLFIAYVKRAPLIFPRGHRIFQMVVCVAYFALPFTLMIYGEKYVKSGMAALIFSNMPVAVFVCSVAFLRERISLHKVVGLALALISLAAILDREVGLGGIGQVYAIGALMLAVLMHAVIYTQCKKRSCEISVLTFNALPCLGASILLLVVGWVVERPCVLEFSGASLMALCYLGSVAGVCGILSYFTLQQRTTAFKASLVFVVFPIVALIIEGVMTGRMLSIYSASLIVPLGLGVLLILIPQNAFAHAELNLD
ncbi:DMT family transporter [Burkholderia cenocepacia]|nr:DMT family transporter [Burkholderia cenocepacia]RQV41678.1 DMT family transporter [Burkholderia cenocepacia]